MHSIKKRADCLLSVASSGKFNHVAESDKIHVGINVGPMMFPIVIKCEPRRPNREPQGESSEPSREKSASTKKNQQWPIRFDSFSYPITKVKKKHNYQLYSS